MVFSFFKKPPEKMVAKPAAAPRSPEGSAAGGESMAPQETGTAAPAGRVAPLASPGEAQEDKGSLDFSDFEFSESPADIQVEEDIDPIESDVEQAAVLYANGQDEATRSILENAVRVHQFGPGERLWLMLFDLYRLTDQKSAFEALGIEFARSFEKSPPVWRNAVHRAAKAPPKAGAPAAGNLLFKGELLGSNDGGFSAVGQALEKNPKLRLDLSKVAEIDSAGCDRLLASLQQARKAKGEIELLGRDHLCTLLESRIETGRADDAGCWWLLLELYQLRGGQEAFEEVAINYAVTFEMSPPSWEPKRVVAAGPLAVKSAAGLVDDTEAAAYVVCGDIKASRFGDLRAFADAHDPLVVDCASMTRIDFISAGALLNLLSSIKRTGKHIVFRHPNHLVAELFGVVGLRGVADIVLVKN